MSKYCSACGAKLRNEDLFCLECGAKLSIKKDSTEQILSNDNNYNKKKEVNHSGDKTEEIRKYLNLADKELSQINKKAFRKMFSLIPTWPFVKPDFSTAEFFLQEAIKLGSEEAKKKLSIIKLRKIVRY